MLQQQLADLQRTDSPVLLEDLGRTVLGDGIRSHTLHQLLEARNDLVYLPLQAIEAFAIITASRMCRMATVWSGQLGVTSKIT